eukprot:3219263-Ditylum_brightwellii.AAC.2
MKPFKKAKVIVKKKKKIKIPKEEKRVEKVASVVSSISTDDTKKLIAKAKKMLVAADEAKGRGEGIKGTADAHCTYRV